MLQPSTNSCVTPCSTAESKNYQEPVYKTHLGSFQVAFGHALEFVHLFAMPDLKTYEKIMKRRPRITADYNDVPEGASDYDRSRCLDQKKQKACDHVHYIYIRQSHITDSYWELLKPEDFSKIPEEPSLPEETT